MAKTTKQTGTKICVRNIPFQAKVDEVRDIFKAFGELKSIRIPKKMTPGEDSHRGFGFVDFNTKAGAKVIMSATIFQYMYYEMCVQNVCVCM